MEFTRYENIEMKNGNVININDNDDIRITEYSVKTCNEYGDNARYKLFECNMFKTNLLCDITIQRLNDKETSFNGVRIIKVAPYIGYLEFEYDGIFIEVPDMTSFTATVIK